MEEFGKVLKNIREQKGLTVNQLALYSKVSASLISRIENEERGVPKPETLQKLASALKIPYTDLMILAGYFDHTLNNSKVMDTKITYQLSANSSEFTESELHFLRQLKEHPKSGQFFHDMLIEPEDKVAKLIHIWEEYNRNNHANN